MLYYGGADELLVKVVGVLSNSHEIFDKEEYITPSLGDMFKKARAEKNISINTAAEYLKIRKFFLQSIENERYELLPGGVYTIGFIKSYAKYLDLDQDAIIAQLKELDLFSPSRLSAVGDEHSFPTSRYVSNNMVALGILILVACAASAYLFLTRNHSEINIPDINTEEQELQMPISLEAAAVEPLQL